MNALEVYAILNKKLKGVISGVASVTMEGTTIKWTFTDGSTASMKFPDPKAIAGVAITDTKHLVCTLSTGDVIDAGELPSMDIAISKESGNALIKKSDGLYVSKTAVTIDEDSLCYNDKEELSIKDDYVSDKMANNTISEKQVEELFNG